MTSPERQRLERLAAKARRRREAPPAAPRLEPGERARLAWTGLARLWVSRRPWRRLELERARLVELDGRRRLQAAWRGSWATVPPQAATLTRRQVLEVLEATDDRDAALPSGAVVVVLGLEALGLGLWLLAWAAWRACA